MRVFLNDKCVKSVFALVNSLSVYENLGFRARDSEFNRVAVMINGVQTRNAVAVGGVGSGGKLRLFPYGV